MGINEKNLPKLNSNKINVAIIGFGNIGRAVFETLKRENDFDLVGIVTIEEVDKSAFVGLSNVIIVKSIDELKNVDVAIITIPSKISPKIVEDILSKGICTVDSYDIHSSIYDVKMRLDNICKDNGVTSIISAGWDPGTDSIIRTLLEVMAPRGISYTNFGPGMSMGHTTCVKAKEGVVDALAMTMPAGNAVHTRIVYVQIESDADFEKVCEDIKTDSYFVHDETHVIKVASVESLLDVGHGVLIERKGTSGGTANQLFKFDMRINNPALTSQILVSAARACKKQLPGSYTLVEIPVIDMLAGSKEDNIRRLV